MSDGLLSDHEEGEFEVAVHHGVDVINIFGHRTTPIMVAISRTGQWDSDRDAIMLEAFLTTSLPQETIQKLIGALLLRNPLSKDIINMILSGYFQEIGKDILIDPPVKDQKRKGRKKTNDADNPES